MKHELDEIQRLKERLIREAELARKRAKTLPPGPERDAARRAEIVDQRLPSSELKPPN